MRTAALWFAMALVGCAGTPSPAPAAPDRTVDNAQPAGKVEPATRWEQIEDRDGIVVSQRELSKDRPPEFRGVATIEHDLYDVLAVIADVEHHDQWLHNCSAAELIERVNDRVVVFYNRTKTPWPVPNRDVVLRSELDVVTPGREIHVRFREVTTQRKGPVKGVIRMPRLRGHYKLRTVAESRTEVEYQVDSDPGGSLPTWMAKQGTRDLPFYTLANLRRQVTKTRGRYPDFVQRWRGSGRKVTDPQ